MTRPIRLGAVNYLNARPLVYGLPAPNPGTTEPRNLGTFVVRFDSPASCARLLAGGAVDLGMVPSITYLDRPDDRVVPGVAIASVGPVASVAIYTRKPIRDVQTIALDTSSRTSIALTRILCARHFDISPRFSPHAPDAAAMLRDHDAALLIGDAALFLDHEALGLEKIDLGDVWTTLTGLPFVWAFWSGPAGAVSVDAVDALQQVKDAGVAHSDEIADAYRPDDAMAQAIGRRYLRENIKYDLDFPMLEGLRTYYREAAALGLATDTSLRFF